MSSEHNTTSPPTLTTRWEHVHVGFPGGTFVAQAVIEIDLATHPDLLERLLSGSLHAFTDARSGRAVRACMSVLVHRPTYDDHILYVPSTQPHRMVRIWARALGRLSSQHPIPSRRLSIAIGEDGLRRVLESRGPKERPTDPAPYLGTLGATHRQTMTMRDARGRQFSASLLTRIDVDADPERYADFLDGVHNIVVSPFGEGQRAAPSVPMIIHAPSARRFVLFVPPAIGERIGIELEQLATALENSSSPLPAYVAMFDLATEVAQVESLVGQGRRTGEGRERVAPSSGVLMAEPEPAPVEEPEDETRLGLGPTERLQGPHHTSRGAHALRLLAALPEQFPGTDEQRAAFDASGDVPIFAWRLEGNESWLRGDLRLVPQLHNLDLYPLVAFVLAFISPDGEVQKELLRTFDVASETDRGVLGTLQEDFHLLVGLYGNRGTLVDAARFAGPYELNISRMLTMADERLKRGEVKGYEVAVERFSEPAFPRVGGMRHPFAADTFEQLSNAAEAGVAVGIVDFWSQEPNLRYLLYNRGFSETQYATIRQRVLEAALAFGIRLPPKLRNLAIERGMAPSVPDLLRTQLAGFTDVHLGLRPSELDPVARWENWRTLLEDAEDFGVEVDEAMLELARSALESAQAYD